MEITFTLCLPRDEMSVPVVRHLCKDSLVRLGVEDECIGDIELAVTEACTNVLKHANGTGDEYDVEVEIREKRCEIRIVDTGGGFDHAERGVEAAQLHAEGGRGIHLMKVLLDDLKFVSEPERGTVVHLVKTLELKSESVMEKFSSLSGASDDE